MRPTITCLLLAALLRLQLVASCHCTEVVVCSSNCPIQHSHARGSSHRHPHRHDHAVSGCDHDGLHERGQGHHHVPAPCDHCPQCAAAHADYASLAERVVVALADGLVVPAVEAVLTSTQIQATERARTKFVPRTATLLACGSLLRI